MRTSLSIDRGKADTAAETSGAVLVHYDRHFDAIARVTGQPAEWVVSRGGAD